MQFYHKQCLVQCFLNGLWLMPPAWGASHGEELENSAKMMIILVTTSAWHLSVSFCPYVYPVIFLYKGFLCFFFLFFYHEPFCNPVIVLGRNPDPELQSVPRWPRRGLTWAGPPRATTSARSGVHMKMINKKVSLLHAAKMSVVILR